jgi:hypothetical protein
MAVAGDLVSQLVALRSQPTVIRDAPDDFALPPVLPRLDVVREANKGKAEVDSWNQELMKEMPSLKKWSPTRVAGACDTMRKIALKFWKRNLRREATDYLTTKFGPLWATISSKVDAKLDAERLAISDILTRSAWASFWDWDAGSSLIFWRWAPEFQVRAKDCVPVYVQGKLPRYWRHQPKPKNELKADQVTSKLAKVRKRGYIEAGRVESLTGYFEVPKTKFDKRMVYDASKCGLNDAVWAPNFFIPSPNSLFNVLDQSTWMADIDLGEFFLNFPLDKDIRPYAGVDLTPYFGKKGAPLRWVLISLPSHK